MGDRIMTLEGRRTGADTVTQIQNRPVDLLLSSCAIFALYALSSPFGLPSSLSYHPLLIVLSLSFCTAPTPELAPWHAMPTGGVDSHVCPCSQLLPALVYLDAAFHGSWQSLPPTIYMYCLPSSLT